jgi:hypothetical protein
MSAMSPAARGLRSFAAGAGAALWLTCGGFVGWAGGDFARRWLEAPREHGVLAFGLVLVGVVAPTWLAGSGLLLRVHHVAPGRHRRSRSQRDVAAATSAPAATSAASATIAGAAGTADAAGTAGAAGVAVAGRRQQSMRDRVGLGEAERRDCGAAETTGRSPRTPLPPAAQIELRLLRSIPDLAGDVPPAVPSAVVQFVACLALHRGECAAHDAAAALGGCARSVAGIADMARQSLGGDHVVMDGEGYRLSSSVSCDWSRFQQAATLASRARRRQDVAAEIEALHFALALVGDGPPSPRTLEGVVLAGDGLVDAMYGAVRTAALRRGELGVSLDLAALAAEHGQRFLRHNLSLDELARLCSAARRQPPAEPSGRAHQLAAVAEVVDGEHDRSTCRSHVGGKHAS